jgi:hypothetical protein
MSNTPTTSIAELAQTDLKLTILKEKFLFSSSGDDDVALGVVPLASEWISAVNELVLSYRATSPFQP